MSDTEFHQDPAQDARPSIWKRGLSMIVLAIFFAIAETLLVIMALVQFVWVAIHKEKNDAIADFGASMSDWLAQVAKFQTFATEERPFPWAPWPKS